MIESVSMTESPSKSSPLLSQTREQTTESMTKSGTRNRPWSNIPFVLLVLIATTAVVVFDFASHRSDLGDSFFGSIYRRTTRAEVIEGEIEDKAKIIASKSEPEEKVRTNNASIDSEGTASPNVLAKIPRGVRKYTFPLNKSDSNSRNRNQQTEKRVLNIHVVPHTHDDVGWLKTVDQYYNGWNNTIQVVSVREILTSVVEALEENPSRTFTFAEIKFFAMWWNEQPESVRRRVQKLVRETKQLTFINGGWCMHDEASTHYIGMIDQTTLGHSFLKDTFDYIPTVGWQLDPFGHSSTQASLMTYKMGFNALYFGRIDYQDLELRHATKECEGLWNTFGGSSSSGRGDNVTEIESKVGAEPIDEGSVFWGLTGSYMGNYGSPGGYCLDVNCGEGRKSFIDKNRTALIDMIQDFLLAVRQQSDRTKGHHLMLTMGSDFQYQRALVNFANLDLLIGTIMNLQEDGSKIISQIFGPNYNAINMFYSSPEYYTLCKYNETLRHRIRIRPNVNYTSVDIINHSESSSFHHHLRKQRDLDSKSHTEIDRWQLDASDDKEIKENSFPSSSTSPVEYSIKRDDFFPYSDCPNCFWTGYFTSRPSLKRFERFSSSFLLAARQVESTTIRRESNETEPSTSEETNHQKNEDLCEYPMNLLEDAVSVLQHHDGVSGTSKQHVAYDYAKLVQIGIDALVPCTIRKLKRLLLGDDNGASEKYLTDLTFCQLLNETKCGISLDATATKHNGDEGGNEKDLYVIVYNSLASNQSAIIDLPIGSAGNYIVEDMQEGSAETIKALPMSLRSPNHRANGESFVLSLMAESLPAVGAKVFRIKKHNGIIASILNKRRINPSFTPTKHELNEREDGVVKLSNGHFSVLLDTKTGNIRRIGTQDVGTLSSWGYYTSFDSKKDAIHQDDNHNSGAYIFRPSTPNQELQIVSTKNSTIVTTSIGTEIHTEYEESWIRTITRIRKETPFIEIEYQVGPVPIGDDRGKEVVTRYNTGVNNDATFYTDSNGREFLKRRRNHRPTWDLTVFEPVAGNYYPINAAIYVDEKENTTNETGLRETGPAFAVVTDRTQGGGSILDGTIELMVHRRTLVDDYRGVDEPINETDIGITPCPPYGNATRIGEGLVIRGKHRILVEKTECKNESECGAVGGAQLARSVMDAAFAEPLVFVGTAPSSEEIPFRTKGYSGLKESLPKNVMLITKRLLYQEGAKSYLVRLGHQYGESVEIDLSILFPNQSIEEIRETTLSGNRDIDDWRKERFDWNPSETRETSKNNHFKSERAHTITLTTMDIRTIIVKVK